jgi:hypothetical protein
LADRIRARCRFCRLDFYLSELARSPEGRCPRCGRRLAPAYTNMVVREAGRVCRAHSELLEAVRLLVSLPGNLELIPHTLIRDLLEEVDWQEEIAQDRELIRREIDELEKMARSFARVVGHDDDHVEFRTGLRRLAQLLTRHADRLDAGQQRASEISGDVPVAGAAETGAGPVRAAATRLEALSAEHRPSGNAEDDTAGALEAARASIEPVSEPETAAVPATAEHSPH